MNKPSISRFDELKDWDVARARMYRVAVFMHRDTTLPDHVFIRGSRRKVSQAHNYIIKDTMQRFPDYYRIEVNNMHEEV